MTEQTQERLSALMDGELERDELRFLLRRLEHDSASVACWSRYCVTRQVLRRGPVMLLSKGFVASTMARIDSEEMPTGGYKPWLRWVTGGAIAASVALVALSIGNPTTSEPGRPETQFASSTSSGHSAVSPGSGLTTLDAGGSSIPVSVASAPLEFRPPMLAPSQTVSASRSSGIISSPGPLTGENIQYDPRLRSYLIRHYEATGAAGQSGFVPYALLVVPSPATKAETGASSTRPH